MGPKSKQTTERKTAWCWPRGCHLAFALSASHNGNCEGRGGGGTYTNHPPPTTPWWCCHFYFYFPACTSSSTGHQWQRVALLNMATWLKCHGATAILRCPAPPFGFATPPPMPMPVLIPSSSQDTKPSPHYVMNGRAPRLLMQTTKNREY